MGRIAQAGFNKATHARVTELEQRAKDAEDASRYMRGVLDEMLARLEALEAKRGPGRPPNAERNAHRRDPEV